MDKELITLSLEEMIAVSGGKEERKTPEDYIWEAIDWLSRQLFIAIGKEGVRVASAGVYGNAAAVIAYK